MDENKRLDDVLNMVVNSSALMMAAMTSSMANAVGEVGAAMGEAVSGALGGEEQGARQGEEIRAEVRKNVSANEVEGLKKSIEEMRAQLDAKVSALTPEERASLIEDIGDESFDRALSAIEEGDFGLPKITERVDASELAGYLKLSNPRFDEIMQLVFASKPPRVFAQNEAQEPLEAAEPEAQRASPAPAVITELPAMFVFPPKFTSTITFPCEDEIMLNWSSTCSSEVEGYGICVESDGSKSSMLSGGTNFYPNKGRIDIKMTNLESFPLTVEISMEVQRSEKD